MPLKDYREAMIEDVLRLTGVPEQDWDATWNRLARMSDDDIGDRLEKLHPDARRMAGVADGPARTDGGAGLGDQLDAIERAIAQQGGYGDAEIFVEPTRNDKIEEIMDLTGVPPESREMAFGIVNDATDGELDSWLVRLHGRAENAKEPVQPRPPVGTYGQPMAYGHEDLDIPEATQPPMRLPEPESEPAAETVPNPLDQLAAIARLLEESGDVPARAAKPRQKEPDELEYLAKLIADADPADRRDPAQDLDQSPYWREDLDPEAGIPPAHVRRTVPNHLRAGQAAGQGYRVQPRGDVLPLGWRLAMGAGILLIAFGTALVVFRQIWPVD